jgi:TolB-like protein/tetratricopeptide (TPR) repeat protein
LAKPREVIRSALGERYEVISHLGSGGMADVYLARDTGHGRDVAVKIVGDEVAATLGADRFLREVAITARLLHPHICPLLDSGRANDLLYYVMPLVRGETLRARLSREHSLGLEEALKIAGELADALDYAHGQGVVHRDVKPGNVFLESGHALLSDFGIALAAESADVRRLTDSGVVVGTTEYLSPEQCEGRENVDGRADIYALGCVLFEMLAGQPPFTGRTRMAILAKQIGEAAPSVAVLRPDVPREVDDVIRRCLAKAPADRFRTAAELRDAIEGLRNRSQAGASASTAAQVRPGKSRPRRAAALAGLAAVLVGAVLIRGMFAPAPSAHQDAVLILPFQVSGAAEFAYLGDGLVDLIGRNLEGVAGLRAVDPHTAIRIAQAGAAGGPIDADRGRRLARESGARLVLLGALTEHEGELALSARLYDETAGGPPLHTSTAAGPSTDLFAIVEGMTRDLLASQFGPASVNLTRLAARRTTSLEALKHFLRGEQALRSARYDSAIAGLQRAVAEDTSFALGYYRLAVAAALRQSPRVTTEALVRALHHADRLGEHDRRLLEAFVALWEGRVGEAEAAYRSILEDFPDDLEARVQLGGLLTNYNPLRGRPADEGWPHLARVSAVDPAYVCPVCTMVNLALADRDTELADSLMRVRYGDSPIAVYRAGIAAALGDSAAFEGWAARSPAPGYWQASWAAAFFHAWDGAERLLLMRPTEGLPEPARAVVHFGLGDLHAARLRWRAAEREIERVALFAPERALLRRAYLTLLPFIERPAGELERLLREIERWEPAAGAARPLQDYLPLVKPYLTGLACASLHDLDGAHAAAARLEADTRGTRNAPLARDLALTIRADAALRREQPEQALAHLDSITGQVPREVMDAVAAGPSRHEVADILTQEHARYLRVHVLLRTGRADEALRWADNGFFRIGGNPLFTPALDLLRAEAHEAAGAAQRAREYYAAYLEATAGADEDMRARPEQARARLEALMGDVR